MMQNIVLKADCNPAYQRITVLYILIFRFYDTRREDERFWTE